MQIEVRSGSLSDQQADAVVVPVYENERAPVAGDAAISDLIGRLVDAGDVTGTRDELLLVPTLGTLPVPRLVVLGLGRRDALSLDRIRIAAANLARFLRRRRIGAVLMQAPGSVADASMARAAQTVAEGIRLGLYTFTRHKSKQPGDLAPRLLTLLAGEVGSVEALQQGVRRGEILAEAANFARDMANEPSNYLTPTDLASNAREAADEAGLECQVLDREDMVELGMGALLGVAKGSHEEPKFIVLSYRGDPGTDRAIGLVGKGITFDTGGISIKPAQNMEEMKGDMSGGASVIAALRAIGKLKPRINVTGIVPATENMPGGGAIKPGDVLVAMNGTTIEVINTDAEGRLILADGISYARKLDLSPIVDIATLTGAISVALGDVAVGVVSNNQQLTEQLISAGRQAGEKLWQLPLFEEYREQITSEVADIKNTGGRKAGSITAAWFLAEFVDNTPWAHLDMAGVDIYERESGWLVKGASGIPVRTLVNFVLDRAAETEAAHPEQTARVGD